MRNFLSLLFGIFLSLFFICCEEDEGAMPGEIQITIELIDSLPGQLNECSGLCYFQGDLLSINDSGGGAKIFQGLPTTPQLWMPTPISGASNVDWEAIASNSDEIIIGDIGNNFGSRQNLVFYHLSAASLALLQTVPFSYPDQSTFDQPDHNFDCEALTILNQQYYLFTKNRGNDKTNLYTAPLYSGTLSLKDSVMVPAPVTDVCFHADSDQLLLLCNETRDASFVTFLCVARLGANDQLEIVEILDLEIAEQVEAITWKSGEEFYVASEKETGTGGRLYRIQITGL